MHLLAERCILRGLHAAGVVTGDMEEMLAQRIGALFMPHGEMRPISLCLVTPALWQLEPADE